MPVPDRAVEILEFTTTLRRLPRYVSLLVCLWHRFAKNCFVLTSRIFCLWRDFVVASYTSSSLWSWSHGTAIERSISDLVFYNAHRMLDRIWAIEFVFARVGTYSLAMEEWRGNWTCNRRFTYCPLYRTVPKNRCFCKAISTLLPGTFGRSCWLVGSKWREDEYGRWNMIRNCVRRCWCAPKT